MNTFSFHLFRLNIGCWLYAANTVITVSVYKKKQNKMQRREILVSTSSTAPTVYLFERLIIR